MYTVVYLFNIKISFTYAIKAVPTKLDVKLNFSVVLVFIVRVYPYIIELTSFFITIGQAVLCSAIREGYE